MFNLDFLGSKKKPQAPAAPSTSAGHPPASERVQTLSSQGYSESEMIRALRAEGYTPNDVDKALRNNLKSAALPNQQQAPGPSPGYPDEPRYPNQGLGDMPPSHQKEPWEPQTDLDMPQLPGAPTPPPAPPEPQGQEQAPPRPWELPPEPEDDRDDFLPQFDKGKKHSGDFEEVAESVVEEKWELFQRQIEEMNKKVEKVNSRISLIENSLSNIKSVKKDEVTDLKEGLKAYRDSLNEMTSKMEALEHTVKDSLTPMLHSLRSLSDTLKSMKQGNG